MNSSWEAPTVIQVTYGCDWNLCNTPRILSLLPSSLDYSVDQALLTASLIALPAQPVTSCLSCSQCVNTSAEVNCPSVSCNGTCYIDDHVDDPDYNTCTIAFSSECVDDSLKTSFTITGNYYIDENVFGVTEIDAYCNKDDCNDQAVIATILKNITATPQVSNQLYFRPNNTQNITIPTAPDGSIACYTCYCMHEIGDTECQALNCSVERRNGSYCEIVRNLKDVAGFETITLAHVQRDAVPYKHYILAEEELTLFKNLTWIAPAVNRVTYVCDWELCNDPRIVDKLSTSFTFDALPSEIAEYLQSNDPLTTCYECNTCNNDTDYLATCNNVTCSATGHCLIDQFIDDPAYAECGFAFDASCQEGVTDSSIIITATYSIDDDILDIDEVDVYCSANNCNQPTTVQNLVQLLSKDIKLDPLFFFRPAIVNASVSTTTSTSTTVSTTTRAASGTTTTSRPLTSSTTRSTTTSGLTTTPTVRPVTTSTTVLTGSPPSGTTTTAAAPPPGGSAMTLAASSLSLVLSLSAFAIFIN